MDLAKIRKKAKKGKKNGKSAEPRPDEGLKTVKDVKIEPAISEEEVIITPKVENEDEVASSLTTTSEKEEVIITPKVENEDEVASSLITTSEKENVEISSGFEPAIKEILGQAENESNQEVEESQKAKTDGTIRLLLFILGRERYAIVLSDIQMIIEARDCTIIPGAPSFIEGIITQRGSIVCVINMKSRLKLKQRKTESSKIIIIEKDKNLFGLLVDAIDVVLEVPMNSFEVTPEAFVEIEEEFVEGVFHHKGKAVARLNLDAVLNFEV